MVPKAIIYIVEDIKFLLLGIEEHRVENCSRMSNKEADTLAKKATM